jgi:hypothetical protein
LATATEALGTIEVRNYLRVMDSTGDTPIQWDPANPEEVSKAEAKFNELKALGFMAYKVGTKGERKREVIQKFDPTAERIVLHSQFMGG